jgi:hypothetical protein
LRPGADSGCLSGPGCFAGVGQTADDGHKPLDDHHLEMRIKAPAARCGVTNIPVSVGGNSTGVDGLGPTHRIYLRTNLASVESPDQIEFIIGHELKHYVMGDTGRPWNTPRPRC